MKRTYNVIIATAPGHASGIAHVRANDLPVAGFQLKMPPAAALRGRVTDAQGIPIAGAMVWTFDLLEGVMSARTDHEGRYNIADLPPWNADKLEPEPTGNDGYYISTSACFFDVQHPNYAKARPLYKRVPDVIDVVLNPPASIEGRVVDETTGQPAAEVVVSMQSAQQTNHDWQQTTTDNLGRYRLTSLAAGKVNIWAQAPDRACAAIDSFEVTTGLKMKAPDLTLVTGGWLEGNVSDAETGAPIHQTPAGRELRIGVYGPSRPKSGAAVESTIVDEQGHFRIRLAPGKSYPYIMSGGNMWKRTQLREFYEAGIDIVAGEIASIEFRLLPTIPPKPPKPSVVRLPIPVQEERDAAAAIRSLGGWYQLDENGHFIEVNMVYHETPEGVRHDNPRADTDAALAHVAMFPHLTRLLLKEGQASDESLKQLAQLIELEIFFVWDATRLSDTGVRQLAVHRNLRKVHISNAGLTDDALKTLGQLPNIEKLSLQGNAFTDAGLAYLRNTKQLRLLYAGRGSSHFTDAGLEHLIGLENLESLGLQGSAFTEVGNSHLKKLTKLQKVSGDGLKLNRESD